MVWFSLDYRIAGIIHTSASVVSADIFNEQIVVVTTDRQLSLWNAYDLSTPVFVTSTSTSTVTLRFFRSIYSPQEVTPVKQPEVNLEQEPNSPVPIRHSFSSYIPADNPSQQEESYDSILNRQEPSKPSSPQILSPVEQTSNHFTPMDPTTLEETIQSEFLY